MSTSRGPLREGAQWLEEVTQEARNPGASNLPTGKQDFIPVGMIHVWALRVCVSGVPYVRQKLGHKWVAVIPPYV